MRIRTSVLFSLVCAIAALVTPTRINGQSDNGKHHHYKLIDVGTFPGLSIYNARVTSNGSTPTEFQQVLNNQGTLVGGADTPLVNPFNCFNPFNQAIECYVQHAFVRQQGKLTDLGTLAGGSASFAFFVSDNGLIAGGSENGNFDPNVGTLEYHAVLWNNGAMTDLGTLGGSSSLGTGVNDAGQVAGFAQNATPDAFSIDGLGTQTRAFLWQNGKMRDLHTLGGPDSFAQFVNNNGQVAGVSYTSDTPDPNTGLPQLDPFIWESGKGMKDLGNFGGTNDFLGPFLFGLNNDGEVTGTMALTGDQIYHAFLWDGKKLIDLNGSSGGLGGNYSFSQGLNDAGEVVGIASLAGDQLFHAFVWQNGVMTDLGTLHGDPCSEAQSINSSGQIVGASQSAAGGCNFYTRAFLWENGGPSVDLNSLVPPNSGLLLLNGSWINDKGEITGRGAPPGCGDADICGHAFLLIPCDANHPNVEGCDYSLVEGAAAAGVDSAEDSNTSAPTSSETTLLSPAGIAARFRALAAGRNRRYGALQTSPRQ
jgi:probable HAF family extracellular repeat protein